MTPAGGDDRRVPIGQVIRSHSYIYYVLVGGQELECRPRGKFRLEEQRVLAGDLVEVVPTGAGEGRIEGVLPRRTQLSRPPVANADQCVIVFTLKEPEVDLLFLDRLLVQVERAGLSPLIVLNKADLCTSAEMEAFQAVYAGTVGYPVLPVSALAGTGLPDLARRLQGRTSVLAGHSGVGKSRLIAALAPGHAVRVGGLSQRLGRGKHTTRHVELIPLPGGGLVADTPGFTHEEFPPMERRELAACFPEFARPAADCRFDDCLHRKEPDCGVRAALAAGRIPPHRYQHYLAFLAEVEAQRKW